MRIGLEDQTVCDSREFNSQLLRLCSSSSSSSSAEAYSRLKSTFDLCENEYREDHSSECVSAHIIEESHHLISSPLDLLVADLLALLVESTGDAKYVLTSATICPILMDVLTAGLAQPPHVSVIAKLVKACKVWGLQAGPRAAQFIGFRLKQVPPGTSEIQTALETFSNAQGKASLSSGKSTKKVSVAKQQMATLSMPPNHAEVLLKIRNDKFDQAQVLLVEVDSIDFALARLAN